MLAPRSGLFLLAEAVLGIAMVLPSAHAWEVPSLNKIFLRVPSPQAPPDLSKFTGLEIPLFGPFVFRPAHFQVEGLIIAIAVVYLVLHYLGAARNKSIADAWTKTALPLLRNDFAVIASDVEGSKGALVWNGGGEAVVYASGRRNVDSLQALFTFGPWHDPLGLVYNFVYDIVVASPWSSSRDSLDLVFTLPQTPDNISGVFALVHKSALRRVRKGRYDLTFARLSDNDDPAKQRALGSEWAIMSESPDITDSVLGEPSAKGDARREQIGIQAALESPAGKYFDSLVLTDQPAIKPEEGPIAPNLRVRKLVLSIKPPRTAAQAQEALPLLETVFNILDILTPPSLTSLTLAKLKRTRAEVDQELVEQARKYIKEEEEEARQEAKRKAEKEKLDKLSPAEREKRKQVEAKRAQRKQQGRTVKKR